MDVPSILLGFLMRGSFTGYELKQFFSISFSFFSGLSYGSIYPALRRMTEQGLVTMVSERQTHAPDRKVYTITDKGREAFRDALRAPIGPNTGKSPFLMRLFFFEDLAPEDRLAIVQSHLADVRRQAQDLEAVQPQIAGKADRFQYLCFEFGLRFYKDLAANLNEVLNALQAQGSDAPGDKRRPS